MAAGVTTDHKLATRVPGQSAQFLRKTQTIKQSGTTSKLQVDLENFYNEDPLVIEDHSPRRFFGDVSALESQVICQKIGFNGENTPKRYAMELSPKISTQLLLLVYQYCCLV